MDAALIVSWAWIAGILVLWHIDNRRHDEQLRRVLDRVSTEPRLEMRPAEVRPVTDVATRKYIADHEADDAAWNEYRGEPQEDVE